MEAAVSVPVRPRAVTIVGWIWLVVAALQCAEGVIGLVVWKVAGLDEGLPALGIRSENVRIQFAHAGNILRYALPSILARIVFAALAAWAAFELLRMKPWARKTLVAVSALGILLAIGLGVFVYVMAADAAGLEGIDAADAAQARGIGAAVGVFITLLFSSFFGATLYALTRRAVRNAFENAA
jgi:hypothetical protein